MSNPDDKQDNADQSQEVDAESMFKNDAVTKFAEAARAAIMQAREEGTDFAHTDVMDFLMPKLANLDRDVTESAARRDGEVNDLASLANKRAVELNQLMGRRRREQHDLPIRAKEEFARAMLGVVDGLDAAAKHLADADESVLSGIQLISRLMDEALKRQGFSKIDALGSEYDPNHHEGMGEMESPNHENGTVIDVVQSGYMSDSAGNLLRAAKVIVAKNPPTESDGDTETTCTPTDTPDHDNDQ